MASSADMRSRLCLVALLSAGSAVAQVPATTLNPQMDLASLREDVRGLLQRVGELQLRIEDLERQNKELAMKAAAAEKSYATLAQMNAAIVDVNEKLKAS